MTGRPDDPRTPIEAYLRRLTRAMAGIPQQDREGIVLELRGHLEEHAEAGGDALAAALRRLGPPEALARAYSDDLAMLSALNRGPALGLVSLLIERSGRSLAALLAAALGAVGFLFAAAGWVIAGAKLVAPGNVGVWTVDGRVKSVGIAAAPPAGGSEILGYWIIPVAILLAALMQIAASRVLRSAAARLVKSGSRGES